MSTDIRRLDQLRDRKATYLRVMAGEVFNERSAVRTDPDPFDELGHPRSEHYCIGDLVTVARAKVEREMLTPHSGSSFGLDDA